MSGGEGGPSMGPAAIRRQSPDALLLRRSVMGASVASNLSDVLLLMRSLEGARNQRESAPSLDRDGLPEIAFDLSFLDQREAVDIEQAEVRDLQMRYDRQRQESDLQEGFRQRTAELARRSAERE